MSELFLKIINMSISASWLVLVVLAFRFIFRKAPKWVNVLLWGIVAVRLICPFAIESSFSLVPDSVGNGELVAKWADDYIDDIDIHHPGSVYYDAAVGAGREPISDGEGGYYVVTKHDQLGEPDTIENTVIPTLSVIWVYGVILLAIYTVVSYWRLQRKVSEAVILRDNIFQSENVGSPFVLGIIKPRIYLPYNMDEQDLEHVVAHERAHIRRKDHLWKPLGFLLLTIHWFNPLMWLAYVLLCRDIELACDEKVIQELGNEQRADYSQALVACSVNRRMIAACPLAFGEVGVKERVKSVLNYKKPAFWVIAVSVVACVVVAVCFLTNPINAIEGSYHIEGYGIYNGSEYYIVVNDGVELKCTKEQYEQVASLMEFFRTGEMEDTPIQVKYKQFLISHKRGTVIELEIPENERFGKTYTYEKEGIMGKFTITLYNDGTFSYYEGMASSYLGFGSWTQNGDAITLTDDGHGGLGLINHFEFDKTDLIFVEEGSSNFIYVKVQNGERFYYTGEAVKPEDATVQPGNSETLSLDDVVTLSKKGYDLTWSDFNQYRYIETGSGLYIRVYEINEMFELWIGGSWTDEDPMYIWLTLADDLNTRIDIRDGGVEEFITKDYSETLLNRAIYEAILDCNVSEKTVGLNNCASFIMLDKEEISGTPVVGSTDHVGVVTVYGLALYQGYDMVDGKLHEEAGSHTPVAITFDVLNGRYSLKEYWRPGDGTYYEPDIREKFPDKIEDEAMNTQKYIAAQKQECHVQAMRNNGEEVSDSDSKPLSAEELSWFNEIFYPIVYDKQGNPISVNPVSGFFSSYYDDVRNMDFEEFMRYFPEDGSFASDAEFEALKIVEAWPFDWVDTRDDMPVPIHKYQARIVDMVLKENAGITTADLNTSDVAYLADYDAFYNYTSDFGPGMFTCTRGEVEGDIVRLYEEFETGTDMLTLRKVGDNYMIVAHQCVEGDNNAERVYGR